MHIFCLSLFLFNDLVLSVLFVLSICIFSRLQSLQQNRVLNFDLVLFNISHSILKYMLLSFMSEI